MNQPDEGQMLTQEIVQPEKIAVDYIIADITLHNVLGKAWESLSESKQHELRELWERGVREAILDLELSR